MGLRLLHYSFVPFTMYWIVKLHEHDGFSNLKQRLHSTLSCRQGWRDILALPNYPIATVNAYIDICVLASLFGHLTDDRIEGKRREVASSLS